MQGARLGAVGSNKGQRTFLHVQRINTDGLVLRQGLDRLKSLLDMEKFYDFNYNEYIACFVSTSTYPYSIHQVVSIRKCLSDPMNSVLLL